MIYYKTVFLILSIAYTVILLIVCARFYDRLMANGNNEFLSGIASVVAFFLLFNGFNDYTPLNNILHEISRAVALFIKGE